MRAEVVRERIAPFVRRSPRLYPAIRLTLLRPGAINLTSAELLINKNLTISGPGANLLTVQRSSTGGTPDFRIVRIAGSVNATISGLTIANGIIFTAGNNGGGVLNAAGSTLTITNSTISGNRLTTAAAIYNSGTMTITSSTISGNSDRPRRRHIQRWRHADYHQQHHLRQLGRQRRRHRQ